MRRSRVVYLVFIGSIFFWFTPTKNLRAPGNKYPYSGSRLVAHYLIISTMTIASGWYSVIQIKRDWNSLKHVMKKRKTKLTSKDNKQ